jgi:hypothetical protein
VKETSPLPPVSRKHLKEALVSTNEGSVKDRLKLFEALENVNKELMKARAQVSAQRRLTYAERQQQRLASAKIIQAFIRGLLHRQAYRRTMEGRHQLSRSAIRIQAFARAIQPRLQYRLRKLQEKLDVVNQRRRNDLMLIQLQKWRSMEEMRKEAESRKMAVATAQTEHEQLRAEITQLQQENATFVEEQQKLTEVHLHFTMMRMMTEQTLLTQNKNYETVQEAVQALTEKNCELTRKQQKLENRIASRTEESEVLESKIQYEIAVRSSVENFVAAIVGCVESRCNDERLVTRVVAIDNGEDIKDDPSLDDASLGGVSRGTKSIRPTECGFELSIVDFEDDDVSVLGAESTVGYSSHRHRSDSRFCTNDLDVTEEGDEVEIYEEEIVEEYEVVEEEVIEDECEDSCGDFSCDSSAYMERSIIM